MAAFASVEAVALTSGEKDRRSRVLSYLAEAAHGREVQCEAWPVQPKDANARRGLWARTLEDSIALATGSLARDTRRYASQVVEVGEALRAGHHRDTDVGILAFLRDEELCAAVELADPPPVTATTEEAEEPPVLIQCGKCGGRATWYLKQTRSADEPMTQFCTCTKCGAEWRQ